MSSRFASAARRGLTLIELVVVIAILAIIALMVIPRLDFLKAQAEHATAGDTMGDVATMIQTYKSSSNKYPTMDLLVDTSGAIYSKLEANSIRSALTPFSVPSPGAGATHYYRSFYDTGFSYGFRHDNNATNASDSGTQPIDVVNAAFTNELTVATITTGGSATSVAGLIRNAIYPGGVSRNQTAGAATPDDTTDDVYEWQPANPGVIPDGRKLVVFGIGPKSSLIGQIMTSAPKSAMGADDPTTTYCRYLAIFEIFGDGSPARFKMVTDHRGRQVGSRIEQYRTGSAVN